MSDFLNKVVTIILIFVNLVLGTLLLSYMCTDMVTERLVLNETSQFIDRVTDKGIVTDYDLNEFYLSVNSHGTAYDVSVERYQLLEEPLPGGGTKLVYFKHDDMYDLSVGKIKEVQLNIKDAIQVTVSEVTMTAGKRLFWNVMHIDSGKFKFTLAGTVR